MAGSGLSWGAVSGPHSTLCVAASPSSPSVFPLSFKCTDQAENVVIGCLVRGFLPPKPVNVTWGYSGQGVSTNNFPPVFEASTGLYSMTSQLTLPAAQCPEGTTKTCHVKYNSNFNKDVDVPCKGKGDVCPALNCEPQLSLRRPALKDLLLGSDARLTCTLSGLKNPEGATFTWNPSGGKDAIQGTPQRDSCGCYSVSSVLPGCAEPWNRGETFSCTATHPESKSAKTATITKTSGSTFRPQVHLLPPPAEELALNELVTLTCLVRGFSPEDVLVRWLHGAQELPQERYLTWGPLSEAGRGANTFAVTSVLRVEAEDWKNGDNFSCMVGHETLPLNFTQKTIDRLAGKPTHVNVSVILSEVDGTCY